MKYNMQVAMAELRILWEAWIKTRDTRYLYEYDLYLELIVSKEVRIMPWAKDGSSFKKHAHIEHTCKCGKIIRGNGFYNHARVCPVYQAHKLNRDRETIRITTNPSGQFADSA